MNTDDTQPTTLPEPGVAAVGPAADGNGAYNQDNVQILRDAAHIRRRPGVYIGDVGVNGLHHLLYELVYNSIDEALAGYCHNIHVKINLDGSATVADDGRGIPVEEHPEAKRPTLEVVLTTVGAGAKFDKNTYKVSAGLHGMGAKAVTALSEWTEARVRRNGRVYMQEYERGKATSELKDMGAAADSKTGTTITFKPDPEIFHDATFDFDTLESRLRELAFLNKGLAITLHDERTGKKGAYHYEGGIAEFVAYLNRNDEAIHPVVYADKTVENVRQHLAERGFEQTLNGIQRATPPTLKLLDGEQEAKIIATRLGPPPMGYANWTLRLLACKVVELSIVESISHETVRRTLKKVA